MGLFGGKAIPSCSFPEHHEGDSGGFPTVALGFLAACLVWVVFGWVIHILLIALLTSALILITGGTVMGLMWMHRHTLGSYGGPPAGLRGWQQQPRIRASFPAEGKSEAVGQHLHLHLGGMTPAERAEAIRQLRGGQS